MAAVRVDGKDRLGDVFRFFLGDLGAVWCVGIKVEVFGPLAVAAEVFHVVLMGWCTLGRKTRQAELRGKCRKPTDELLRLPNLAEPCE